MRILRSFVALLSLVALTLLFVVPTSAVCSFLNLIPRVQFIPALLAVETSVLIALIVLTLLLGRFYCAALCPLGILQDLARRMLAFLPLKKSLPIVRPLRTVFLAVFLVSFLFGCVGLLDPYGIFGRFLSIGIRRFGEPGLALVIWALALPVGILVLTAFRARWWCNQICPVGTFLGTLSRAALFRVRIRAEKCVGCGACAKACEVGAIRLDGKKAMIDPALCVVCSRCVGKCPVHALARTPQR